ncbi:MAG: cardiolipin synthase [Chitinophagales bacterium]|nr:cardiolipin synthase [Chitinophagales bacterium]
MLHGYTGTVIIGAYLFIIVLICIRVLLDTVHSEKTVAYLFLVIFFPVIGIIIYFTFGVNFHKRKLYKDKSKENDKLLKSLKKWIDTETYNNTETYKEEIDGKEDLVALLLNDNFSPLTNNNKVTLLNNGENKFPDVFEALEKAEQYIHIEYYIYEDDVIGNKLKDLLIKKANEGIAVRVIFDDFGSHGIKKHLVKELRKGGVEVHPFYEIKFFFFADRYNYRNHRKIIIVDGKVGFTGGINVSDKYVNSNKNKLYWRDTHIKIEGEGVYMLQYHFLCNWNFCCQPLKITKDFFPDISNSAHKKQLVQIAASGPDSDRESVMLSFFTAIVGAKKQVYITSPYFIPGETIMNAIIKAALSGVDVRLLIPGKSDSNIVNYASRANYGELLSAGVRVFMYKKGFVHAKTIAVDENLSVVGSANMDLRSFDLNFELVAVVYNRKLNQDLRKSFLADLEDSKEIFAKEWNNRSKLVLVGEALAKLISPVL